MHRQDARGVLPLDTATRCVYTYSTKEWFDIIKKRVYHTTGKAHPNATIICKLIEQELNELGIRLEDVTVELEKEAYEEMRHNI